MSKNAKALFNKQCKYSIRKLTIGTCSIMIGAILLGIPQVSAHAEEMVAPSDTTATPVNEGDTVAPEATPGTDGLTAEEAVGVQEKPEATQPEVTPSGAEATPQPADDTTTADTASTPQEQPMATPVPSAEVAPSVSGTAQTNNATPAPTDSTASTAIAPANATAESAAEWQAVGTPAGTISVKVEEGVRYNALSATPQNDNGRNAALFHKEGLEVDEAGNASVALNFVEESEANKARFGVFLKYKNADNNIFVISSPEA